MKWYKRLSNGLIAVIVVAVVAVIVFVGTAIIVPKVNQNKAADGFFTAIFKDPPRNPDIKTIQDSSTGAITLEINAPTDYDYLEIRLYLVVENADERYFDFDTISYIDDLGYKRKEIFTFKAENIKKGNFKFPQTYQPSKSTIKKLGQTDSKIEIVKYK